jgi:hypothetical protein
MIHLDVEDSVTGECAITGKRANEANYFLNIQYLVSKVKEIVLCAGWLP